MTNEIVQQRIKLTSAGAFWYILMCIGSARATWRRCPSSGR
jgi:hypothetical protein